MGECQGKDRRKAYTHLRRMIDEIYAGATMNRLVVLVCGPAGMGQTVRRVVGRWVRRGVHV